MDDPQAKHNQFFRQTSNQSKSLGIFFQISPRKDQAAVYSLTFAEGTKNGKQINWYISHDCKRSLQICTKSVTVESIQTVNLNSIICYPQTLLPSARDFLQLCFSHVTPLFFTSSLTFSCHSRASVNNLFFAVPPSRPNTIHSVL